jgi:hypothetical protein
MRGGAVNVECQTWQPRGDSQIMHPECPERDQSLAQIVVTKDARPVGFRLHSGTMVAPSMVVPGYCC